MIREIKSAMDRLFRNDINANFRELDERIDNVVKNEDEGSLEVVDARYSSAKNQTYNTLGKRIDATENDMSQKRDKLTKLTQADLDTSSEVNRLTPNHLSQEVKNMMSGSTPVSPNLADGQVTTEKLASKAVIFDKVNGFTFEQINIFNKNTVVSNSAISPTTGAVISNSGVHASDWIEVEGNATYTTTNGWEGAFYDTNKAFIKGRIFNSSQDTFTTPANARYFRTSVSAASLATYMMMRGTTLPGSFKVFENKKPGVIFGKTEDVNSIRNQLTLTYSNKKWCVVGDSLTASTPYTSKSYHAYVSESVGLSVYNLGMSGTGYKRTDENNTAFYQRITSVPLDSDVVTIFGSGNDLILALGTASDTGTSTVAGCINKTIDNYYTVHPTTPIGIISPTPWGIYPNSTTGNKMEQYNDLLREICKRRSIPFLDLYNTSGLRPWDDTFRQLCYSKDSGGTVHPDENGHKIFSSKVREFVKSLL